MLRENKFHLLQMQLQRVRKEPHIKYLDCADSNKVLMQFNRGLFFLWGDVFFLLHPSMHSHELLVYTRWRIVTSKKRLDALIASRKILPYETIFHRIIGSNGRYQIVVPSLNICVSHSYDLLQDESRAKYFLP